MIKKLILLLLITISMFTFSNIKTEFEVIKSKNVLDATSLLLDINTASKDEMLKNGISKRFVDKLVDYREITGGYSNLKEMIRISGIGKKTYEKLKTKFQSPTNVKLNRFNINQIDDKVLIYYGFSKNEIKLIREYQADKIIRNNLELKEIISKKQYDKLKDVIEY